MCRNDSDYYSSGTAATQSFLTTKPIKNFKIPLPPLPEQKRIVEILDESFEGIDRAIANTEKNLANARELFESYLNAIFTQKGDDYGLGRFIRRSQSQFQMEIINTPPKVKSGIPFITISNIDKQNRVIDFTETFNSTLPNKYDSLKNNRRPYRGDLLYTSNRIIWNTCNC